MLYSLVKAAELAKCEPENLLVAGSAGDISLCIRVPEGVEVLSVDTSILPGGRYGELSVYDFTTSEKFSRAVYLSCIVFDIDILFLDPAVCGSIIAFGQAEISSFPKGGKRDLSFKLTEVFPGAYISDSLIHPTLPHRFVTYLQGNLNDYPWGGVIGKLIGNPKAIRLDIENIFITSEHLDKYLDVSSPVASSSRSSGLKFRSHKLTALFAASNKWKHRGPRPGSGKAKFDDFSRREILVDLLKSFGGRRELAKSGAAIVRPLFARNGGSEILGVAEDSYVTPQLLALDKASEVWALAHLQGEPEKHVIEQALSDAFKTHNVEASKNLDRTAAAIIRPEWAEDGRQTNQPKPRSR